MYKLYLIYDKVTGVVDKAAPDVEGSLALNVAEDQDYMEWEHGFIATLPDYSWVEVDGAGNRVLITAPTKPPHHEWDWTTKSWFPNLDAARNAKLQSVTTELNARLYLPCNGFDADKVSRERISGTIARLQRGDGLPAGWVGWRDASNQQQWVTDSAETVLANLTALSCAIEDREQALLITAWSHKANIAALVNIEAVMNYNVDEGWEA